MDVDPNYDPSDFLTEKLGDNKIQDDLAVSESDEETTDGNLITMKEEPPEQSQQYDDGGDLWF